MSTSRLTERLRDIIRPGGTTRGPRGGLASVPGEHRPAVEAAAEQDGEPSEIGPGPQPATDDGTRTVEVKPEPASQDPDTPAAGVRATPTAGPGARDQRTARAAAALGGEVIETASGPCVVIDRRYAPAHWHGQLRLGACADHLRGTTRGWRVIGGLRELDPLPLEDVLFLDLETTGLAGGAGTHAFLVGCAWFEADAFRIRQFFMLGHALERPLLQAVADRFADVQALVTYNGKTFDVPVLETRFLFHRQAPPALDRPHLDMLHPARRLWRGARPLVDTPGAQSESCSLATLERVLFGVARYGDVPGFEIPGRYFAFLRSGDASPLEPVLEHNRLDLVSLAAVTARAFALADGPPDRSRDARECLGMARLFDRAARLTESRAWFERTLELTERSWHADHAEVRCEALRALAVQARRAGHHAEAAGYWEAITRMSRCPPGVLRDALHALAVHHEHRSRDLARARAFAQQSRRMAAAPGLQAAVDQRLARLDRKLRHGAAARAGRPSGEASLWS